MRIGDPVEKPENVRQCKRRELWVEEEARRDSEGGNEMRVSRLSREYFLLGELYEVFKQRELIGK